MRSLPGAILPSFKIKSDNTSIWENELTGASSGSNKPWRATPEVFQKAADAE